jgi:hypothetical protein
MLGYLIVAVEGVKSDMMSGEPILTSVMTEVGVKKTDTVSITQRVRMNMTIDRIMENGAMLRYVMMAVNGIKSVTMSGKHILTDVSMDMQDAAMLG